MKNSIIIVLLISIALGAGFWLRGAIRNDTSEVTVKEGEGSGTPSIGGNFNLTDVQGKSISATDFSGKLMLVYFGFSHCPDICPTDLAVISEVIAQLKEDKAKIQPVFITIDPARDTAERLAVFMKNFDPHILALTGTESQVKQAESAYKVYSAKVAAEKKDGPYMMDHSAFMYLMGKNGEYLAHFPSAEPADKIVAAVRKHF